MKTAGRYVGRDLPAPAGTIIYDSPTFSWGITRIWWTPEDVVAQAPMPEPSEAEKKLTSVSKQYRWHPFDRWITRRYLDADSGTASLVSVWHSHRSLRSLARRYPRCKVVKSWSGGELLEAHYKRLSAIEKESILTCGNHVVGYIQVDFGDNLWISGKLEPGPSYDKFAELLDRERRLRVVYDDLPEDTDAARRDAAHEAWHTALEAVNKLELRVDGLLVTDFKLGLNGTCEFRRSVSRD